MQWLCAIIAMFVVPSLGSSEASNGSTWDWAGCNPKSLCECKLNGEVAGVKGKDIASECMENGYAIPASGGAQTIADALAMNKLQFQCDSLKLNAFCYSQNGCLTDANQQKCEFMKGKFCDVNCNAATTSTVQLTTTVFVALSALVVTSASELQP
eukprot:TRINITY_DN44725_c0_g1_i1.p1 TRINITY_DN44725_c0_g1~~TRINITY_DN44725_c0_g1_i1.p1  ORF type:complete len:155 (+),score=15.45 TRINITY_DN44725_c0_g1_i1:92-556(+)